MKQRAIIWLRVSTAKQEVESQKKDLVELAKKDGYKENQLLYIEGRGVSARTQNEKYLKELQNLYDTINETPGITCVYAWEVSRLARIQSKLHELGEELAGKKIQLVIIEPKIRLLKDDGTVDSGEELKLSILGTLAKQEMEIKLARSRRGRDKNRELGKFNGGAYGALYGYRVEKDGYIVPDKDEVKVVQEIFELYATGKYSVRSLAKELRDRGYSFRGRKITDSNVLNLLKNELYIGNPGKWGRTYTPIIDLKLWKKAKKVRDNSNLGIQKTKEYRHTHLATKILKCKDCGYGYVATRGKYVCYKHSLGYRFPENEQCKDSVGISIEVMDGILWNIAREEDIANRKKQTKESIPGMQKEMKILGTKRATLEKKIFQQEVKRDRIIEDYEDGYISREKRNMKIMVLKEEISAMKVELEGIIKRMKFLRFDMIRIAKGLQDKTLPVYDQFTQTQKREVVVQFINSATVERVVEGSRKAIKINIFLSSGKEIHYLYYYTIKNKDLQLKKI